NSGLSHYKGDVDLVATGQPKIRNCSIPKVTHFTDVVHLCCFDISKVVWYKTSIDLELPHSWKILPPLLPGLSMDLWQFFIPSN
ncbi:hypothetical protein ABG768_018579, partial [Culter alburnus]